MNISSADTGLAAEQGSTRPGMPDPGSSLHIASLDYYCTFSELTDALGQVSFAVPDPVRFSFSFETSSVQVTSGVFEVSWDYSWFDQTTVEADIAYAMAQIVAAVANLLDLDVSQVNKAVLIRRIWTFAPNLQVSGSVGATLSGSGSGRVVTSDVMTYPPRASADQVQARSGTSVAATVASADFAQAAEASLGFGADRVTATEGSSIS